MRDNDELHVVFGASGGLGNAVVHELSERGKKVRAVNRSGLAGIPEGVEVVTGDASDIASARLVCEGAEVVYSCVMPPYTKWPEMFPPIIEGIIEGAASAEARLVYGDNLYMYGPVEGAITEDLPNAATGVKGKIRALLAERILEAHEKGRIRATVGRASDFYGPQSFAGTGELIFKPALKGKKAKAVGNIDVPHTFTYTRDFARGLIILGEKDEALGEVWHIPSADTLTTREFIEMVFEEAGTKPKIQVASRFLVSMMSMIDPFMRELKEMLYEWEKPYIVDHSKFERTFGNHSTPHREAIRQTLDWFSKQPD